MSLKEKTLHDLSQHVVGIGEELARDVYRLTTMRASAPESPGASLQAEARMLARARTELLAVCKEMRSRAVVLP